MKILTDTGVTRLCENLKTKVKIVENKYVYTTTAQGVVSFTLPNFDATTCTVDVYVNGLMRISDVHYTVSNSVLTFVDTLEANQTCYFVIRKIQI